jgi:hypothetical protein
MRIRKIQYPYNHKKRDEPWAQKSQKFSKYKQQSSAWSSRSPREPCVALQSKMRLHANNLQGNLPPRGEGSAKLPRCRPNLRLPRALVRPSRCLVPPRARVKKSSRGPPGSEGTAHTKKLHVYRIMATQRSQADNPVSLNRGAIRPPRTRFTRDPRRRRRRCTPRPGRSPPGVTSSRAWADWRRAS